MDEHTNHDLDDRDPIRPDHWLALAAFGSLAAVVVVTLIEATANRDFIDPTILPTLRLAAAILTPCWLMSRSHWRTGRRLERIETRVRQDAYAEGYLDATNGHQPQEPPAAPAQQHGLRPVR